MPFFKKFNPPSAAVRPPEKYKIEGGLKYPLDTTYPAYIQYRNKKVLPATLQGAGAIINAYKSAVRDNLTTAGDVGAGGGAPELDDAAAKIAESVFDDGSTLPSDTPADADIGMLGFKTQYRVDDKAMDIKLYMPQAIQIQDNIQYDQVGLGLAGAAGLTALNRGSDMLEAVKAGAIESGKNLASLFGFGGNSGAGGSDYFGARIAAARAASLVGALGAQGPSSAVNLALQVKVNPNTRSIFTGVTVRNFVFTYDFYAKSRREADTVQSIIKKFRRTMYPRAIPLDSVEKAGGFPLGYEFPDLFEIKFRFGNSDLNNMPQPLLCHLRDINTTYNPTGQAFHNDGNHTHVQMNLSFQEFRTLNAQDIEKGH